MSAVKVLFHSVVSKNRELEDVLDFICMMGKFHIHKAQCLNFKPNGLVAYLRHLGFPV